jgi:hypothetical protein
VIVEVHAVLYICIINIRTSRKDSNTQDHAKA